MIRDASTQTTTVVRRLRYRRPAQPKHLNHTDVATVQAAAVPDDAKIAARRRQLDTAVKSCVEVDASANIETAGGIFQATADRL